MKLQCKDQCFCHKKRILNIIVRILLKKLIVCTKHIESHLLGGLAKAIGGHKSVEAGIGTFALLDEQRAAIIRYDLVDVLVILNLHLVVGLVGRSLVPGEIGERTATDLSHNADVGALFDLHELL